MGWRVETYPKAAVERAMKVQEVLLRAVAKKITWWQAAEGKSAGPVPGEVFRPERAALSREASDEHGIELSYTWVKLALQGARLVAKARKRGVHRKRRERRPLPGMLCISTAAVTSGFRMSVGTT